MKESLYIAGRYSRRDEFRQVRDKLIKRGYSVTSRWLNEDKPLNGCMGQETSEWYYRTQAVDLVDIFDASAVLFFAEDPKQQPPRGGRHVEFGYALGLLKPIYVIGPHENVFHFNPLVVHFNSLEDFLASH